MSSLQQFVAELTGVVGMAVEEGLHEGCRRFGAMAVEQRLTPVQWKEDVASALNLFQNFQPRSDEYTIIGFACGVVPLFVNTALARTHRHLHHFPRLCEYYITLVHDFLFAVLDIDALLGGADSFA